MLADELRDLLRELCVATAAAAAALTSEEDELAARAPVTLRLAVASGTSLVVWYDQDELPPDPNGRAAALERTARAVRACVRRWEAAEVPPLAFPEHGRTTPAKAMARTVAYLEALARSVGMKGAVVARRAAIVATGGSVDELERDRVAFIVRRVQLEADRQGTKSSHAELIASDSYAVSFWYDACLVCFFGGPWSIDFVRHRARQVTRELSQLLAMMDDPDLDPIQVQPPPGSDAN